MAQSRKPRPKPSPLSREARQRKATPQRLRELFEYPETHRALAHNPSTPLDVLRRLVESADPAIVRGVAINRGTPDDLLVELATNADERIGRAVAKRTQLPDHACALLAASPHYLVQWTVVCRKQLSVDAIDVLVRSPESTIRRKLVQHLTIPAATLAIFAADPDPTWALDALKHRSIASETVAELARHSDPAIRAAAVQVLAASPGDEATPESAPVLDHADVSPTDESLRQMLASPDHRERAFAVEKIEALSPAESELHAHDVCWLVRRAVAARTETGPAALRLLVDDPSVEVRDLVGNHRNAPADLLQQLADTRHVKIAGRVARNPNTLPSTLTYLAERWSAVRIAIARHPDVPPELLWSMAEQGAPRGLRAAIARSANVNNRICLRAAADSDVWVRRSLAGNKAATAESLSLLASDEDTSIRVKLASNPKTPADLLEKLGADPHPNVRKAVAHNGAAAAADRVLAALL